MSLDRVKRGLLGVLATALVLFAECVVHTDGAVLSLSAMRPSDGALLEDATGRTYALRSARVALTDVRLLPCVGEAHAEPTPLLGVSRAFAHGEPVAYEGALIDLLELGVAPVPIDVLDVMPGRYCHLEIVFGPLAGTPTFALSARSELGEDVVLETSVARAITRPLDPPIVLDEASLAGDVVLVFDPAPALSRFDPARADEVADPLRALSEVIGGARVWAKE